MINATGRALVVGVCAAALAGCVIVEESTVAAPAAPAIAPAPTPPMAVTTPAPAPPAGPAPLQVANPDYVTIPMEITVNAPIADVWARIGKYCDIAEWFQIASGCTMTSGVEGEFGSVRSVGAEILVGKTEYSYTYTQPVREGRLYNMYHGTLEARPVNATTTRLIYTLVYDLSLVAGDKQADVERRRTAFNRALGNMKILAEGGTLPAPAPRPS